MNLDNASSELLALRLTEKDCLRGHPERSFLSITDLTKGSLMNLLRIAAEIKTNPAMCANGLNGRKIAMLFQKTSTRTKESFSTGAFELGMYPSYINWINSNFILASLEDEIKVLSQWYDVIMARVNDHKDLLTMKQYSEVPIINGLCDRYHPCQALADLMTIREFFGGDLSSLRLAYVGDGNNVCNSLVQAAAMAGVGEIRVATPRAEKYKPLKEVEELAASCSKYLWTSSVNEAVDMANVIYTDTWVSIGEEHETEERLRAFEGFQINSKVMSNAAKDRIFMHDLPAHVGQEVSAEVLRGGCSVVYVQAQNRKHAQKALLLHILSQK